MEAVVPRHCSGHRRDPAHILRRLRLLLECVCPDAVLLLQAFAEACPSDGHRSEDVWHVDHAPLAGAQWGQYVDNPEFSDLQLTLSNGEVVPHPCTWRGLASLESDGVHTSTCAVPFEWSAGNCSAAVGYPPTAVGYPPTAVGCPSPAVGYPPTAVGYPPTAVGYPPTAVGYPPSAVGCPSPAAGYPPTAVSCPPTAFETLRPTSGVYLPDSVHSSQLPLPCGTQ